MGSFSPRPFDTGFRPRINGPRLSIGFLLTKRFTLCAFANFVDVLRLAADEGDRSRHILCDWKIVSDSSASIPSSSGVSVQPNERFGDPTRFDYLVVIGGLIDEIDDFGNEYIDYLRQAARAGVPLIGVCTGAFLLHRAGLLDGYKCCVSWFHHRDFLEQFDGLNPVSDQIFVVDRDRLTCSGGVSSAHLAAHLVERHIGRAQASKSLHIMIIDDPLAADKPQPGLPLSFKTQDPIVLRALMIAQQSIETPLSVADIAGRMNISKRQLERRFQTALDLSPQVAFMDLRLTLARHLLETTDRSITTIAVACGFCDSSHMSRMFRRRFGHSPFETRSSRSAADTAGAGTAGGLEVIAHQNQE
ncbi:GlxA family transcriptional regulator [Sphingomonadaceae bacterium jetA1]|jgi:transcriptional regulator GlxA family with amidase domain|uniref:GlxA family transcriptional regulator n=1 Tax=Facivitalis istanbulensis TaxID=3075838 RepID=UPI0034834ED0